MIGRFSDQKVSLTARAAVRRLRHEGAASQPQGGESEAQIKVSGETGERAAPEGGAAAGGVWPKSWDARKGRGPRRGGRGFWRSGAGPGDEARVGNSWGRVYGVGVTMRWGLGRGLKGPGTELERGRVWGAWAWSAGASSSGVPTRRRRHQTRPCPPDLIPIPFSPLVPQL